MNDGPVLGYVKHPVAIAPRHACPTCEQDTLTYSKSSGNEWHMWVCTTCTFTHCSADCCDHPPVKEGDWIVLTRMDDDPDPIPVGTLGLVYGINRFSDGTTQVNVRWAADNRSRGLMLVLPADRYEKAYVITELP